jgi:hypothetical protein
MPAALSPLSSQRRGDRRPQEQDGRAADRAGTAYYVQDFAPGEPVTALNADSAALLIDLLERRAGLDPAPERNWSDHVTSMVWDGGDNGPRAFLHGLGKSGRGLLSHFDQVLNQYGEIQLPGDDLVHGEFNSCNVQMKDGQDSGVIDIQSFGSGTRTFGYGDPLREAYVEEAGPDTARLIRQAGEAVAGPGALAMCVAAIEFTLVQWQANHDPNDLPWVLAGLHRLADDLASHE